MRTALDTNIFSALLSNESTVNWITHQLDAVRLKGPLCISGPVFSELMGYPRMTPDYIKYLLAKTVCSIDFEIDEPVWRKAGEAFAVYTARRRQEKEPRRLITDFIIGAHASLKADQLITLDATRYRKNFPDLTLITHAQ